MYFPTIAREYYKPRYEMVRDTYKKTMLEDEEKQPEDIVEEQSEEHIGEQSEEHIEREEENQDDSDTEPYTFYYQATGDWSTTISEYAKEPWVWASLASLAVIILVVLMSSRSTTKERFYF